MKRRKAKDEVLMKAASGLMELVTYFCCIRPRHQRAFQDENGEFQMKRLDFALRTVREFRKLPKSQRKTGAKKYRFFQKVLNDTFSIPSTLISRVLGTYRDESGIQRRVTLAEVEPLVSKCCVKASCHGHSFAKGGETPSSSWSNRWKLVNVKRWRILLSRDADVFRSSSRVATVIRKFVKSEGKDAISDERQQFSTAIATNEKNHGKGKDVNDSPSPESRRKLIRKIEEFANEGKLTKTNYRTLLQVIYGERGKPGVGTDAVESAQTLRQCVMVVNTALSAPVRFMVGRSRIEYLRTFRNSLVCWMNERRAA